MSCETSTICPSSQSFPKAGTHQIGGIVVISASVVDDQLHVRTSLACPDGRKTSWESREPARPFLDHLAAGRFWECGTPVYRQYKRPRGIPWRMWMAEGRDPIRGYQVIEATNAGVARIEVIDSAFMRLAGIRDFHLDVGQCKLAS